MKTKFYLIACLLGIAGFMSCNKSDEPNFTDDEDKEVDIYFKFTKSNTRADTDSINNLTAINFTNGALYFTDSLNNIVRYIRITNDPIAGTLSASELENGTVIQKVLTRAKRVHVFGNFTPTQSYNNISEIESIDILSQQNSATNGVENVGLYGYGNIVKSDPNSTHQGVEYSHEARFNVLPLVARLEIEKITAQGDITGYNLEGIYINNFYYKILPTGKAVANSGVAEEKVYNFLQEYRDYLRTSTSSQGKYADTWYPFLFDDGNTNGSGGTNGLGAGQTAANGIELTPQNEVWAYNVFAEASVTPHIVFHFTDLEINGTPYNNTTTNTPGEAYLTITGYTDVNAPLGFVNIEGGNIYRMEDVEFDEDDLGTTPESKDKKDVLVQITLLPWKVIKVKPDFE